MEISEMRIGARSSTPISAEARGQLRAWKAKATARFGGEADQADYETNALIEEFVRRSSRKGRARVFEKIRRRFAGRGVLEGVRLDRHPIAVWSVVRPYGSINITKNRPPRLAQDCAVVDYLMVGMFPSPDGKITAGIRTGLWTLEVPDHALGRLLDRSPGADLDEVLFDAHHAALSARLDDDQVRAALDDRHARSFMLPAGDGVFRCEIIRAEDASQDLALQVHLFAHTWLHDDQLYDDQVPVLVAGTEGNRLGQSVLLPAPLREFRKIEVDRFAVAVWAPGMPEMLARPMGRA
jgi:hypothetical protein